MQSPPASAPCALDQYASLITALFHGPFQDSPWADFLDNLRALTSPCIAVIGLRLPTPGDSGIAYVGGAQYSAQDLKNFANQYSALAPLIDLPDGVTVSLDDLISRKQLHQTVYYQSFMKPANQEQLIGFDIHHKGKVGFFLRLIRGQGEPDFNGRERQLLDLLIPPCRELARWLEHNRSLIREHQLHEQAFSSLVLGSIILDANMHVIYINSVAEQLLENNPGITQVNGKLRVLRQQEHQEIQQAVARLLSAVTQGLPHVIPIARQAGHSPLFLTLRRLPQQDQLENTNHIALYMTDPELRRIDQTQLVMEAFGLTPQEARLVISLANGGTLEDFAGDTGVSKNTARTHLYASFRKIGVSQQSALVSHVIRAIYGL